MCKPQKWVLRFLTYISSSYMLHCVIANQTTNWIRYVTEVVEAQTTVESAVCNAVWWTTDTKMHCWLWRNCIADAELLIEYWKRSWHASSEIVYAMQCKWMDLVGGSFCPANGHVYEMVVCHLLGVFFCSGDFDFPICDSSMRKTTEKKKEKQIFSIKELDVVRGLCIHINRKPHFLLLQPNSNLMEAIDCALYCVYVMCSLVNQSSYIVYWYYRSAR